MNNIYEKDYLASRVISFKNQVKGYDCVYYKTTDNLIDLLDIDFYNKDVFTILGSTDHLLTARYLEANKVDSFDINRLTLYYFYLRIWTIKYTNELYPLVLDNNEWLKELLLRVKPSTSMEKNALLFYKKHILKNTNFYNLFYDLNIQPEGKTIFTNCEELKDCVDSNINFYNYNILDRINHKHTYDILLISNILDWARNDTKRIEIAERNIYRLLNNNGIVVCTSLVNRSREIIEKEKEIFSDNFIYEKHDNSYCYIKKS